MVHVLDDFLFINDTAAACEADLRSFLRMCDYINIPIAPKKTFWPSTCIIFLGIELDSVQMAARLPCDKIQKALNLLDNYLGRRSATLKEMQSLIGVLNFNCSVVPGRAFLRRLIDLTTGVIRDNHHIRLNKDAKDDMRVWHYFLRNYNGT